MSLILFCECPSQAECNLGVPVTGSRGVCCNAVHYLAVHSQRCSYSAPYPSTVVIRNAVPAGLRAQSPQQHTENFLLQTSKTGHCIGNLRCLSCIALHCAALHCHALHRSASSTIFLQCSMPTHRSNSRFYSCCAPCTSTAITMLRISCREL